MATIDNKAKKLSKRKESIDRRLPQRLIPLHALNFTLPCMSNLGKIKLWLTSSRCSKSEERPWPQLVLLNSDDSSTSYNYISSPYSLVAQEHPNGSDHDWRIVKFKKDIKWSSYSDFWRWDSPFSYASRSSNYRTLITMEVHLTYTSSPALMALCINEHDQRAWIRYECTMIDHFDAKRQCMQFTRIVGIEDKIYALSLQGTLAVIEDVDSRLMITAVSSTRGVPSVSSKYFKEYFVEMNGEILLVFLIYKRSLEIVDEVEVFRLCFVKLKWIKVERLQGKTVFLDRCGIWANSEEVGCKENCVYFTQGLENGWCVFDMGSCCISPATEDKACRIHD